MGSLWRNCTFLLILLQIFLLLSVTNGYENGDGFVPVRRFNVDTTAAEDESHLSNSSFTLATDRTRRKDPLDRFRYYTGGWNITDHHYWASVGFSAAPLFLIGGIWFFAFGLVLCLICCCYFCFPKKNYSYSGFAYALSLTLLILFTLSVIAGSAVLYDSLEKFHKSTRRTLDYIVDQADVTGENLKNLSDSMAEAKKIQVNQNFLPAEFQSDIDRIQSMLTSSASNLAFQTKDNSDKIRDVLDNVRLQLIIVAAVMLGLASVGFLLSILGLQCLVSIFVIIGWILVAATFISAGVFLLMHNVFSDTCVAMEEWAEHPHSHTALDNILPCVDPRTADESLLKTKQVTFQVVDLVNNVIGNICNQNITPGVGPAYYNQSGPLAPLLCNPFTPSLTPKSCSGGEIRLEDAAEGWKKYICRTSGPPSSETCATAGRFTPNIYNQITAAVTVATGLYHNAPFLIDLEDCTFVRDTFSYISKNECPGLSKYSKLVYFGLTMVSTAVMLSLVFWVVYARERRHRKKYKEYASPSRLPLVLSTEFSKKPTARRGY